MAGAKIPRVCATISPIDHFAMNPTFSILRSLPPRPPFLSKSYRARHLLPTAKLPARYFSATATSATDLIPPFQQESVAKRQRQETLQESNLPTEDATTSDGHTVPTTETSSYRPSIPTSEPTAKTCVTTLKTTIPSDLDFLATSRRIIGTVIRTHTMAKTVAVSTKRQHFDRFLQKYYTKPSKTLVHDPDETLVEGDVIEYGLFPPIERAERIKKGKGKRVKYVVRNIVTPFGVPLDQRVPGAGRV